jgi:hypothetical protein
MYRRRSSSSAVWLERQTFRPGAAELPLREEVVRVKYFKITKTWAVKAESESEAIKLVASAPEDYLDQESVTRTEYKRPQQKSGWGHTIKDQLLGSSNSRKSQ